VTVRQQLQAKEDLFDSVCRGEKETVRNEGPQRGLCLAQRNSISQVPREFSRVIRKGSPRPVSSLLSNQSVDAALSLNGLSIPLRDSTEAKVVVARMIHVQIETTEV